MFTLTSISKSSTRCFSSMTLHANALKIFHTESPKKIPENHTLKFGHSFSDHMFEVDWEETAGWHKPRIVPHGPLLIDPAASSLHYALQGFEGMKAYKDSNDRIRLFRPMMNMNRLNSTAKRLALPRIDGESLLECLKALLRIDKRWIPSERGYSLYIRPTLISTQPILGVSAPHHAKLFIITCPVGPYYKSGFKAVNLLADTAHVRAWPGGSGNVKCGGNYGLTIEPQRAAEKSGQDQIMWLFGPEHHVTEVGTMNMFFFWVNENGQRELITPPLDGTILPGVTRDSILALTRGWKEFNVTERQFTIHEVIRALNEGRVIEAFGAGTAAIVSPVKSFNFEGKRYDIPLDPKDPTVEAGPLARRILKTITDIQYGDTPHEWSVVVE